MYCGVQNSHLETLEQLNQKFNDPSTPGPIKTMILSIAPKSWSENRLAKEFGTSRRQAKNAKELVKKKDFYLREDKSRLMPGKKDFVSIKKDDGKREHLQKQLILYNRRRTESIAMHASACPGIIRGLNRSPASGFAPAKTYFRHPIACLDPQSYIYVPTSSPEFLTRLKSFTHFL
ncbi:unnamed protein product [Brassicogethes aeneus]|uniref:Uncharacterized protein n=1 Tax=Brassicogethes aeneus TaxID=1431903 RepID=A0A9P0FIP7_BRAAE|nr:unnamed protein product [Brassicogethes aeneus]